MKLLQLTTQDELDNRLTSDLYKQGNTWHYSFYWDSCLVYEFTAPTPQVASMRLFDTHMDLIQSAIVDNLVGESAVLMAGGF